MWQKSKQRTVHLHLLTVTSHYILEEVHDRNELMKLNWEIRHRSLIEITWYITGIKQNNYGLVFQSI